MLREFLLLAVFYTFELINASLTNLYNNINITNFK